MALGGRHWDWHIGLYACARVYDYDVMNIRDMMDKKNSMNWHFPYQWKSGGNSNNVNCMKWHGILTDKLAITGMEEQR